jgi:hypothetical protein
MVKLGVTGGQYADGSQKDGFLKYEKNRPIGIYNIRSKDYFVINERWKKSIDAKIGPLPESHAPWRSLLMNPKKADALKKYFNDLKSSSALGAQLAVDFLKTTKGIGEQLISKGVAKTADDVNDVLTNGFYWLYGPINDYV